MLKEPAPRGAGFPFFEPRVAPPHLGPHLRREVSPTEEVCMTGLFSLWLPILPSSVSSSW